MSKLRAISFRSNDAAAAGRNEAIHKYSRQLKESHEREAASSYIDSLIEKYGPIVGGYPSWHPFTSVPKADHSRDFAPVSTPQGFEKLDRPIYFRNAFIVAPSSGADCVIESAGNKKHLHAEQIHDVALYRRDATPVLVTCEGISKEADGTISKRFALGSMLSTQLPAWTWASCGESWETMRRYILGSPCGSRSSLFVNQETGKALREVFELLNRHELFGPVRP